MKIAFIPANVSGVTFYRVWQPALALRKMGHKVAVLWYQSKHLMMHPWEEDMLNPDLSIVSDIDMAYKWADVVVWQGLHTPQSLDLFKRWCKRKPTLTEMDDYVFSVPEENAASTIYQPGSFYSRVILEQMRHSFGLIVSTPYLKELYSPYNPNIWVGENVINIPLWRRPSPRRQRRALYIGWVGGATHSKDLEIVKEPLFAILERYRHVRFVCVHGIPDFFRGHPRIKLVPGFKPINEYPKYVASQEMDIGVAPLVDNNFNRGKSNLRWLEYSAMSIPTVASPLPHFTQAIKHGDTGLIASSPEEWEEALAFLILSPKERKEMGKRANREVKNKWSLKNAGQTYEQIFREVLDKCRPSQEATLLTA